MFCSALLVFKAKYRHCTTNCILVQRSLFGLCLVSHLRIACTITRFFFILADYFMKSRVMYYSQNYIVMVGNCFTGYVVFIMYNLFFNLLE